MTTARNTYVPDQTSYPFYLQQYTRKLFWFFTARYNGHDDLQFSQVIPFPEGSIEFGKQKKHLQARREESSREALGFILQATNAIIGTVEEMGAKGLFANLSQTQRKDIFGAVFDQYPLWLVKMKFRKQEAVAVDFCQIFAGKDSDREKFQLFFRHMFVDMCESTYITHVREARSDAEEAMKLIWAGFAFSSYVEALGLGDQYEFPGISTGINSRGPSSAKVASDDFDSDIEAPKPVPKRAPNGEGNLKNARIWW
jgi:hypothetical protein